MSRVVEPFIELVDEVVEEADGDMDELNDEQFDPTPPPFVFVLTMDTVMLPNGPFAFVTVALLVFFD